MIKITMTQFEKQVPIAILHLDGVLDGANYENLITEAHKVYDSGCRDLILDLSRLSLISSVGLSAMHRVAVLFRGENHPDQDVTWASYRWAAYRSKKGKHNHSAQNHVKLVSPTEEVNSVLDMIGFNSLFEIYTDLQLAVTSFHRTVSEMETSLL